MGLRLGVGGPTKLYTPLRVVKNLRPKGCVVFVYLIEDVTQFLNDNQKRTSFLFH